MARKKVVAVEEAEELEELEELDAAPEEVEEANDDLPEGTLTAKAAATLVGTDQRTFRKFLRKKYGTIGQGKRWSIDEDDVEMLKTEFGSWSKGSKRDASATPAKRQVKAEPTPVLADAELEELEEIDDIDDLE